MTATNQRDQVCRLAKSRPDLALEKAREITEPWFRAQALACVARHTAGKTVAIANEAARAALLCDDAYKQTAVRAWEIAALAEAGVVAEASRRLRELVKASAAVVPLASRAEALFLLLQAAACLSSGDRQSVHQVLQQACAHDGHWRCQRALRDAQRIENGEQAPRPFFQ
ncbi:MAG: hypothetical protein K1X71_08920 [Pirellulales bacterium]|nr:hypothetical protein [Pirellulales bacterium]